MDVSSRSNWVSVAWLYDSKVANDIAALLIAERVPAHIVTSFEQFGDTPVWTVSVPPALLERAQVLMAQSSLADTELDYLATGVLRGDGDIPS
jgi:hypothetical protein